MLVCMCPILPNSPHEKRIELLYTGVFGSCPINLLPRRKVSAI